MGGIGKFFKKLWDLIVKILKVLWKIVKIILVIVLLVLCIYFIFTGLYFYAFLCFVAAYMLDPKTVGKIVGKVAEAIKGVAGLAGDVLGSAASGLLGSKFGSMLLLGAAALLFFMMYDGDSKEEEDSEGERTEDGWQPAAVQSRSF